MGASIQRFLNGLVTRRMLPCFLNLYERWVMYRVREAWGVAHLQRIRKKGDNVRLVGYSRLLDVSNLEVGSNIRIGYGCFFCKGGIRIGDNTILSRNITIYSASHDYKEDVVPFGSGYVEAPVTIGQNVWIGMGVSILPGVTIGDGAIVGMGTIVARDVLPGEIVVGQPFRVIGCRDVERLASLARGGNIFASLYPDQ